jgi:hypothetical protein
MIFWCAVLMGWLMISAAIGIVFGVAFGLVVAGLGGIVWGAIGLMAIGSKR